MVEVQGEEPAERCLAGLMQKRKGQGKKDSDKRKEKPEVQV
jgi:hypothetical protein